MQKKKLEIYKSFQNHEKGNTIVMMVGLVD